MQIQSTYSQDSVTADGVLQEENQTEIDLDFPVVIDQVLVKEGDRIEIGDCIATIDSTSTADSLSNLADSLSQSITQEKADQISVLLGDKYSSIQIPTAIYATAKGTVTAMNLQAHALSPVGEPAVILSDLSTLQVKAQIGESQVSQIAVGQTATITGDALGDCSYSAIVIEIAPTATSRLNGVSMETVVNITLSLQETDEQLKPGYHVQATILTGEENRLMVPYQAVGQDDSGQEYVYLYQAGKAVKQSVTTGIEAEDTVQILSGLGAGDWIVTDQSKVAEDDSSVVATTKGDGDE